MKNIYRKVYIYLIGERLNIFIFNILNYFILFYFYFIKLFYIRVCFTFEHLFISLKSLYLRYYKPKKTYYESRKKRTGNPIMLLLWKRTHKKTNRLLLYWMRKGTGKAK